MSLLYTVEVNDQQNEKLAGQEGQQYRSPAQNLERALALIAILLGAPQSPADPPERQWRRPIAGGIRSVTLRRAG